MSSDDVASILVAECDDGAEILDESDEVDGHDEQERTLDEFGEQ